MKVYKGVIIQGGQVLNFAKATAKGARIGLAPLLFPGIEPRDILKIRKRTEKLAMIMEHAKAACITSKDGTDVRMLIEGRKCAQLKASLTEPGEWGAVPIHAESAIAPLEGTTDGRYEVNRFFEYVGAVTEPFVWVIKDGRIAEVQGTGLEARKCRDILAAADENGKNIGELGVATNHMFQVFTGTVMDKMILGTVHLACGKSTAIGGKVYSNIHHDAVSEGVTLEFDGTKIIEEGRWLLD